MTVQTSSRLFRRWLLALILSVGVAGIWLTVVTWFLTSVIGGNSGTYEMLVYAADGQPYVQSYDMYQFQTRSFRTLDGKKLNFDDQTWLVAATASGDPRESWSPPESGWNGRIAAMSDGRIPAHYWYFLRESQQGGASYFVGYDSVSRRKIGYLDASGFHTEPPREPFDLPADNANQWITGIASSQPLYGYGAVHEPSFFNHANIRAFPGWRAYLIDGNRLLQVDLRLRDQPPRVLFEQPGMLSVQIHGGYQPGVTPTLEPVTVLKETKFQNEALIVSTLDAVIVYDPVEQKSVSFPRPRELVGKALTVYRPEGGGLLMEYTQLKPDGQAPTTIYTFAADGTLADTQEVTISRGETTSPPVAAAGFTVAAPVPVLAGLTSAVLLPMSKMQFDPSLRYSQALLESLLEMGLYPLATLLISAVLAWLCYRRQRRYADPVIAPWVVLIMLLGVPGYLGYRFHRFWPVRLACPACRMPSPSNHGECIDCGAAVPRPDAKGIEVFA